MAIDKIQSESINLADNFAFTGTVTGAGGVNTPAFLAHSDGTQGSVSDSTWTKADLETEVFDTDNAFASSKFTVPSGEAGKYIFHFKVMSAGASAYQKTAYAKLTKNGSELTNSGQYETVLFQESGVFNMDRVGIFGSAILVLSAGDQIELYGQADVESGSVNFYHAILMGYKLIE